MRFVGRRDTGGAAGWIGELVSSTQLPATGAKREQCRVTDAGEAELPNARSHTRASRGSAGELWGFLRSPLHCCRFEALRGLWHLGPHRWIIVKLRASVRLTSSHCLLTPCLQSALLAGATRPCLLARWPQCSPERRWYTPS